MTDSNKVGKNSEYKLYLLVMLTLLDCRQNCTRNSVKNWSIFESPSRTECDKQRPRTTERSFIGVEATAKVWKVKSQLNLVQSFLAKSTPATPDGSIIEWLWRFKEALFELKLLQVQKMASLIFIEFLARCIVPGSKRSLFWLKVTDDVIAGWGYGLLCSNNHVICTWPLGGFLPV